MLEIEKSIIEIDGIKLKVFPLTQNDFLFKTNREIQNEIVKAGFTPATREQSKSFFEEKSSGMYNLAVGKRFEKAKVKDILITFGKLGADYLMLGYVQDVRQELRKTHKNLSSRSWEGVIVVIEE